MNNSTTTSKLKAVIYPVTSIFVLLILWIVLSTFKKDALFYPSIIDILKAFGNIFTSSSTIKSYIFTFLRIVLVLALAFAMAFIITFIYVLRPNIIRFIRPYLAIMRAAPLAIISIYLWLTVGGKVAPYLITFLMVYPVLQEAMITSVDNIDKFIWYALKVEDMPFIVKYFKVIVPMIFPYITMSLLQTFGLGIKVMIMSEYLCQSKNSIGEEIMIAKSAFAYDSLLASLIFIVIIVIVIEFLIKRLSKKYSK